MMRTLPLIAMLLASSPAFGQSRVYTNADLGRPMSRATVTPEEWASLVAHQFRLPPAPERPTGPTVVVVDTTPTFARSTEELIDNPARYATDAYFFNQASWIGAMGGFYGYGYGPPPWPHHRSWEPPRQRVSLEAPGDAHRTARSPGRRRP